MDEAGRDVVLAGVQRAEAVATAQISYVEARAAFARHERERSITRASLRAIVRELEADWAAYNLVEVTHRLVHQAGALAERHALRAYDAVHLAAALELRDEAADVEFAVFDDRLATAARRERLMLARR